MNRDRFELLSAYVDDQLDENERTQCERLLFADADARETYRSILTLRQDLSADPEPQPLPLRLDLDITRMAGEFLAADADATDAGYDERGTTDEETDDDERTDDDRESATNAPSRLFDAPSFWNNGNAFGRGDGDDTPRHPWIQMATAVGLALIALIGMGIFAQRGGHVPALSAVEHRISGLDDFGHEALYVHTEHVDPDVRPPVDSPRALEAMLDKRLDFHVDLPQRHLGPPRDVRVIELEGETVAMADYAFHRVPVTMFALPREIGLDRSGLEPSVVPEGVCAIPELHACFNDGRGTSICAQTDGDLVRLWVAQLPLTSLDKLVRTSHP